MIIFFDRILSGLFSMIQRLERSLQESRGKQLILVLTVAIVILITYFLYSLNISGPVIGDEFGYLNKALALSGKELDAASSWQGGYPFMILPVFWLLHDPDAQWRGVLFLNALFCSMSYAVLVGILRMIFPKKRFLVVCLVALFAFWYPSYVTIGSFAYSSCAYILVMLFSVFFLLKSNFRLNPFLMLYGVFAGYLCWIHPLAISFALVSAIFLIARSWARGDKIVNVFLPILMMVLIALAYFIFIRSWLDQLMTPIGLSADGHYGDFFVIILSRVVNFSYWVEVIGMLAGQVGGLIISTFGLIVYGIRDLFNKNAVLSWWVYFRNIVLSDLNIICAILVLALMSVLIIGSIYFPTLGGYARSDLWIFGRYVEMILLPLLAIFFLTIREIKSVQKVVAIVFITGIVLSFVANVENTSFGIYSLEDMGSFWPALLSPKANYLTWFAIGSVGLLLIGYLGLLKKWLVLIPVLLIACFVVANNSAYHQQFLEKINSRVVFREYIEENFSKGTCVGVGAAADERLLYQLEYFSFYMQDYSVRRFEEADWQRSCNGPLLLLDNSNTKLRTAIHDKKYGIKLLVRESDFNRITYPQSTPEIDFGEVEYDVCNLGSCAKWEASLNNGSDTEVGQYLDGTLRTTNTEGYLLIGPKEKLDQGKYLISVDLDVRKLNAQGAFIYALHDGQRQRYSLGFLSEGMTRLEYFLSLNSNVDDLQVAIYVDSLSEISVKGYEIKHRIVDYDEL